MGERFWSVSGCRPDCQIYGISGQGAWMWTARYGQHWVSGGVHVKYGQVAYECGMLGVPVKPYGWMSEFGSNGQWFEGGAIVWLGGQWVVKVGNWGQTAGRLMDDESTVSFKVNVEVDDEPLPEPEDRPEPPEDVPA